MEAKALLEDLSMTENHTQRIWHPYTQEALDDAPLKVAYAKGAKLFLESGESVIDAISSWWVTLHGHGHPQIVSALQHQLQQLEHVMFSGYTHEPAECLAYELLKVLGEDYGRIFFSDNGSSAVETGLKGIFQYFYNQKIQKKKILVFYGGFHGETFGTMSLSEKGLFSRPFNRLLFETVPLLPPQEGRIEESLNELETHLKKGDVATFIFEPWVQGVFGMKKYSLEGLDQMIGLCREYGIITLADEVMTAMGRLGPNFVTNALKNKPDVVCLAKSLTGGFLPLGATVFRKGFEETFQSKERSQGFLHGHSYSGNPLGCVAAYESLKLLQTKACLDQRDQIEKAHQAFALKIQSHPALSSVEVTKTLLAFECRVKGSSSYFNPIRDRLLRSFQKQKVLIRPFGNAFHVLPPYCITESELHQVYLAIENTLEELL